MSEEDCDKEHITCSAKALATTFVAAVALASAL
jgi:hypothetical protein